VRTQLQIPDWYTWWSLDTRWSEVHERTDRDPRIVESIWTTSLMHREGRCYRVVELTIHEFFITRRWGVCSAYFMARFDGLGEAMELASRVLRATEADLRGMVTPGPGDVVNLGAAWGAFGKLAGSVLPTVGDIGTLVKLSDLLANRGALQQRVLELLKVVDRLTSLDGAQVCRQRVDESAAQYGSHGFDMVARSIQEYEEISCDPTVLARPEGRLIEVDVQRVQQAPEELEDLHDAGELGTEEFYDRLLEHVRDLMKPRR
jgi:hypothetical protein